MALKPKHAKASKKDHADMVKQLKKLGARQAEADEAIGADPSNRTRQELAAILAAWTRTLPTARTRKP